MSELGLRTPAAGKSQRQISPSAWALATARTQRRTFLMLRARRFGQPSSRVRIYAYRGCFSIFASLQPKLPANYAESPGEKQDGIAGISNVPNSKLQHPEKSQASISKCPHKLLGASRIEVSLELGFWNLELLMPAPYKRRCGCRS